ncbi:MAG TPA: MBL fold metallo-hydrolase [Candidatus Limnocylindrales bacterium]|nr:MBL fold metallo-hydrolase [Candidatus Limnocylindrales bacterium]
MDDVLVGYSRGLYSNWLWHRSLHLVVDAGEGLQLGLGARVVSPTHLLITHGHADHVLGLAGFVAARRFGMGDPMKPLTIVHPEGARGVDSARATLERHWPREPFPLEWTPVGPGAELPLGKGKVLRAFAADHASADVALGYLVVERRHRLRAEYAGRPESEIRRLVADEGRERLLESFDHVLFAHTGDTMPLDPALFAWADLLVHDATFLEADDRRERIHATTEEALVTAREAGAKRLVLHHLSVRYERDQAIPALRRQVAALGYGGECWLLDDRAFIRLSGNGR